MFENHTKSGSLNEDLLQIWFEKGRNSRIVYKFLLIIWNESDLEFKPLYLENRKELEDYHKGYNANDSETLIAVYDVFSESRVD